MLRRRIRVAPLIVVSALVSTAGAAEQHSALGLLIEVDRAHARAVASCQEIPGVMEAMTLSFRARHPRELDGLAVGDMVDLALAAHKGETYAERIHIHPYVSAEAQTQNAERLKLLEGLTGGSTAARLHGGDAVPDFTLIDQDHQPVTLSQLSGKVVAVSFMYTKCRLANYCFRLSNNLAMLTDRFAESLGRDLVLLTITFDPSNDDPTALARYAATWKADAASWHFLTGSPEDVQRVCRMFGMDFWASMGMFTHTMHTIVLDRRGHVVANLEGNEFSPRQLGDLVASVINRPETHVPIS